MYSQPGAGLPLSQVLKWDALLGKLAHLLQGIKLFSLLGRSIND